jgi:hypothetical protein
VEGHAEDIESANEVGDSAGTADVYVFHAYLKICV